MANSKSRRKRVIPLNDMALQALDWAGTEGKYPFLFVNSKTGQRMTTITKVWNRLRKAAELDNFRAHDLRHSFASFLVNNGVSIYEVKEILGHSDIKVTSRYAHLAPETQQKAAQVAADKIMGAFNRPS